MHNGWLVRCLSRRQNVPLAARQKRLFHHRVFVQRNLIRARHMSDCVLGLAGVFMA